VNNQIYKISLIEIDLNSLRSVLFQVGSAGQTDDGQGVSELNQSIRHTWNHQNIQFRTLRPNLSSTTRIVFRSGCLYGKSEYSCSICPKCNDSLTDPPRFRVSTSSRAFIPVCHQIHSNTMAEPSEAPQAKSQTTGEDAEGPLSFTLHVVSPSVGVSGPLNFERLPATTTVKELKGRIRDVLPSKPQDENQRLIHRGRMLGRESETMLEIFGQETVGTPNHCARF